MTMMLLGRLALLFSFFMVAFAPFLRWLGGLVVIKGHHTPGYVLTSIVIVIVIIITVRQGGRCCASARAALTERSGSSTKGRTPNIRYFDAKLSIVAIYTSFKERKSCCICRAFNKSHPDPAFVELPTKVILL